MRPLIGREHLLQIVAGHREDAIAGYRIAGDAALEVDELSGLVILVALAKEVDPGGHHITLGIDDAKVTDIDEQPAPARFELHLAPYLPRHGDTGVGIGRAFAQARTAYLDASPAAGTFADRLDGLSAGRHEPKREQRRRGKIGDIS